MMNIGDLVSNRYKILRIISCNQWTINYVATDINSGIDVNLRLFGGSHGLSIAEIKAFSERASELLTIDHPNLERIIDWGVTETHAYLISDLTQELKPFKTHLKGKKEFQRTTKILSKIADALAYLHDHNLIHGYLSPQTVYLFESDEPILINYGIVDILLWSDKQLLTDDWIGIGLKPEGYSAPEIISNKIPNKHSDIYSLGIICYEIVTGTRLFQADTPFAEAVLHATQDPNLSGDSFKGVPRSFVRFVIKAISKKPEDRFNDMESMAHILRLFAEGKKPHVSLNRSQKRLLPRVDRIPILIVLVLLMLNPMGYFVNMRIEGMEPARELGFLPTFTQNPPTPTFTFTPSPTATITPTITPTPTQTPTPYYTPTLVYPLAIATRFPSILPIGSDNFHKLKIITRLNYSEFLGAHALIISSDGKYLAVIKEHVSIAVWNAQTNRINSFFSNDITRFADFSPTGKYLAVGRLRLTDPRYIDLADGKLTVFVTDTLSLLQTLDNYPGDGLVGFSKDGTLIIGGNAKRVIVWDQLSGQPVRINHYDFAGCRVAWSENDSQFLGATSSTHVYTVWGDQGQIACGFADDTVRDYLSYDLSLLANYQYGRIEMRNLLSRDVLWRYDAPFISTISISDDGSYLFAGTSEGDVIILDAQTGAKLHQISINSAVENILISRDKKLLIVETEKFGIEVWAVWGE